MVRFSYVVSFFLFFLLFFFQAVDRLQKHALRDIDDCGISTTGDEAQREKKYDTVCFYVSFSFSFFFPFSFFSNYQSTI